MKKVLLSFVAFVIATVCVAQSSLIATLSHDGNITTFYGAQAWRSAHDAAVHGDVITLSSGTFLATNITKAVTVRGAGMGMGIDPKVTVEPTVISGDFIINIADSVASRLTLEGIYSNHTIRYGQVNNPLFLKCRFKEFTYDDNYKSIKNASFIHCRIASYLYLNNGSSAMCINSVMKNPYNAFSGASFDFQNCILRTSNGVSYSSFKNCILTSGYDAFRIESNCTAYNCIGLHSPYLFQYITNSTNKYLGDDYTTIFKTYKGEDFEKLDNEIFELTETAQKEYLGMDGTEVGIYGGALPYDPTPSNPQITKCNVAAKSTADGKLSVDIEVNTAE